MLIFFVFQLFGKKSKKHADKASVSQLCMGALTVQPESGAETGGATGKHTACQSAVHGRAYRAALCKKLVLRRSQLYNDFTASVKLITEL